MLRIFLLYAISGFVSLGYQVAWFRIFTDWFGSTNLTFALVVCCFIGGLGLGAMWSRPIVDWFSRQFRIQNRLRLYGLIECLVSAAAVLTLLMAFLPHDVWGSFPYHEVDGLWEKTLTYQFGQVAVAILCVLLPCLFMGITFPLLCNAFLGAEKAGQLPSALYAWNTLGACSGVLACQFWLLPLIGHSDLFVLMVVINAILGAYFLLTGGGGKLSEAVASPISDIPVANKDLYPAVRVPGATGFLLTAAALSGLVAGALEGDMFKRISFVITASPGAAMPAISFWAILGIFLGSSAVRALPRLKLGYIKIAYILAIACYAIAWYYSYAVINGIELELATERDASALFATPPVSNFPSDMGQLFLFIGGFVFPAYFLISLLLPWVCNRLQADQKHLGLAYGLNTVAFCLGMIGFTLIAPMVSIFYSLKLIFVLLFCGGLLLFVMREGRPLSIWKPVAAVSIFLVGCILVPGDFDRAYVNPELPPAKYPVTAMKSNGAVTTFVVTRRNDKRLYFGNLSMSSSNALSQTYMRVMAHFPLLAQRNPEKVLLIAFGVGNTASAIAAHNTVSQIDIVDLNSKVFETAPEFSDSNGNVHLDPRVRLIHDDGRSFLSIVDERYDLITSEPPPPMAAGVYRLYSREYYEDVLAHLTPTGMMSQWLPYYQMPPEAVVLAIGTFITVFPHALLISGMSEELILIGASAPFELERIHERFSQSSAVSQDLEQHIISEPVDLYARIMQTSKELQENYAGVGLISDQNNHLDHSFPGWNRIAKISYDPVRVLEELRQQSPSVADELEPIVTHLGRLNFRIPAFPLYDVRPDPSIKYSAVDWTAVTRRYRSAIALAAQGKGPESAAAFLAALQLAPENPHILSYLAQLYLQYDRPAEAEKAFRRVVAVEPERTDIYLLLATAVVAQGRGEDAIPAYRKALSFDPDNADALQQLAWILATHPEAEVRREREAVLLAEQANLQSNGEDAEILNTLAATYAANGRFDKAIQNAEAAIQVAKISEDKVVAEKSRDQLVLYRQHRPVTDHSLQP